MSSNSKEIIEKLSFQFNNSIKVFISHYKFMQELFGNNNSSLSKKIVLIDKIWFTKYQKFYLFDKIYKLIKTNNLSDLDLIEQQIIFNNLFNEFSKQNLGNNLLFYDEEFPELIESINDKRIKFINDFEIINEETYQNLLNSMGIFRYCKKNAKSYEFKTEEKNIIIKYKNENEKCFNLLIGNLEKNSFNIYNPNILINFPDNELLDNEYINLTKKQIEEFLEGTFNTGIITVLDQNTLSKNHYLNNVKLFVHSKNNYPQLTQVIHKNIEPKLYCRIEKETFSRALIYYYLSNQVLINSSKENKSDHFKKSKFFLLINKTWMNKFKELFNYHQFKTWIDNYIDNTYSNHINNFGFNSVLNNQSLINDLVNKLSENISNYDSINQKFIINELNNINPFLIDCNYNDNSTKEKNYYLRIYQNFEIIIFGENNTSFINILFPLFDSYAHKYKYQINAENYFLFITKYNSEHFLNIYSIKESGNEITINNECIIQTEKYDDILNNNFLGKYILSLDFNDEYIAKLKNSEGNLYLLKDGDLYKQIEKKDKLTKIIINFIKFVSILKTDSEEKENNDKFIYLAPKELAIYYIEKYGLDFSYINKKFINNNKKLVENQNSLIKYINENFKYSFDENSINNKGFNSSIDFKSKPDDLKIYIKINKNDERIYYYDHHMLLNEEIIKMFNINKIPFIKTECFLKRDKIFLFLPYKGKTIIEIGTLNQENCFHLETLIDTKKDSNSIMKRLKGQIYKNFIESCFTLSGLKNFNFSPFFDEKNNIVGNGYNIEERKDNNFSDCFYDPMLINIIYLIRFFNIHKYKDIKPNSEKNYYLISDKWINEYKIKYKYDDKIEKINSEINYKNIIKEEYPDKKMLTKLICTLISELKEPSGVFIDNNFIMDEIPSEPNVEYLNDNLIADQFYFYKDFFILDEEIHSRIFNLNEQESKEMRSRNNYCKCFCDGDYIFVILNKYITGTDKIVIEVGNLDKEKKFNLIYILVFNTKRDFEHNRKSIKDMGMTNFLQTINFQNDKVMTLESANSNINPNEFGGYIYKYSQDAINNNTNNNDINNIIKESINPFEGNIPPESLNTYNPPSLKQTFHSAPRIGLQNVGATCYMNATIQCFGQIEKFTQYFKYYPYIKELIKKYKGSENKDCLAESFKELIENFWPNNKKYLDNRYLGKNSNNDYYKPVKFKEKISRMNPLFQGVQANDSKDLVNFIVMQLHEELNLGTKINNNQDIQQNDEYSIYKYFKETYYSENKSIISDLFYLTNGTVYQCTGCSTMKYNFQVGFFLIFPLEEVRKFKIQQILQMKEQELRIKIANNMLDWNNFQLMSQSYNIQAQNINSVNIIDCFNYNQKPDLMEGENAMFCNICNKSQNSSYQNYIVDSPEVMIIILNRGQGIQFKVKLEFTEFLNISQFVRNNNNGCNYKLIGVVTHMGESGATGHFVAFCKSPIDEMWYNYNDDLCFPVNNFKEQVIDYAMPYILFYQKC